MHSTFIAVFLCFVLPHVLVAQEFERENLKSIPEHQASKWYQAIHSSRVNVDSVMHWMRVDSSIRNGTKSLERYDAEEWVRKHLSQARASGWIDTTTPSFTRQWKKQPTIQAQEQWRNIGPFTWDREAKKETGSEGIGVIRSIDVHPNNPATIIAGTISAGVWQSANGGATWKPVTDALMAQQVEDVAFAPSNLSIAYAALDVGLARSTTHGASFDIVAFDSRNNYPSKNPVQRISVHPKNPNRIAVATLDKLFESTDGGATWAELPNSNGTYWDLKYAPNGNSLYAVRNAKTWCEFVRYENGLTLFSQGLPVQMPNAIIPRALIATSPAAPSCVWVMYGGKRDTIGGVWGLYKSTDNGASFTHVCCGDSEGPELPNKTNPNVFDYNAQGIGLGQITWDMAFAVSNTDTNLMVVAGIFPYTSTDGGRTWNTTSPIHYDVQDAVFIDSTLWICTDGGLQRSDDLGKSMSDRSEGICAVEVWGFGQSALNNVMTLGAYHLPIFIRDDKLYDSRGYEGGWFPWSGADAMMADVNPDNDLWLYAKPWGSVRAKRHNDKATPPLSRDLGIDLGYLSFSNVAFHPNKTYTLFAADHAVPAVVTTNSNAEHWKILKKFSTSISHVRVAPSNSSTLCVVADAGVWYTSDLNVWNDITPPPTVSKGRRVIDVALDPFNSQVIWVAFGGTQSEVKVAATTNAGLSWIDKSTGLLGEPTNCIAIRSATNNNVFVGTDSGLFTWDAVSQSWVKLGAGLPRCSVHFIHADETQGLLRVGTSRGIWELPIQPDKPRAQISVATDTVRCNRQQVMFSDRSTTFLNSSAWRLWKFPGGNPSTSTERQPLVEYATPGVYSAQLVTGNAYGTDTAELIDAVTVLPSECERVVPKPGGCVNLSTSTDFVTLDTFEGETNTFTFTAWVKPNGYQPSFSAVLCTDVKGSYVGEIGMQFVNDSNEVGYLWKDGMWWWGSGLRLKPDCWNHVALIVDGANGVTVMVNGIASHVDAPAVSQDLSKLVFTLGTYHYWSSRNFNGFVDEVRLYKRALKVQEIRTTMHHVADRADEKLLAWYQFNESGGNEFFNVKGGEGLASAGATRVLSSIPFGVGSTDTVRLPAGDPVLLDTLGVNARVRELQGKGLQLVRINEQVHAYNGPGQILSPRTFIVQSLNTTAYSLESIAANLDGLIGKQDARQRVFRLWMIPDYCTDSSWTSVACTAYYDEQKHHVVFKFDSAIEARAMFAISVDGGPVSVHEEHKSLHVRPIPANAGFHLEGLQSGVVYTLVDMYGTNVHSVTATDDYAFVVTESLPSGMYILRSTLQSIMIPVVH